ncbi:MAG TPA: peptidase MA family metallohydrolase [Chloroflexota bacterium]
MAEPSIGASLAGSLGRAIAIGVLALLMVGLMPGRADAAADVRVLRSGFESRFPQSIAFSLDAAVLRPIQKVTVSYRVAGRRTLVVGEAQVTQGTGQLHAEALLDLSRRYLPPGTALQYNWQIEDDRGEQFRSETFAAMVEDRRFQWRQARAANVELSWARGDNQFGQLLMQIAVQSLQRLAGDAGVTVERPVRIFVYSDLDEFRSASYRGGLEWVGGTYYPRENVILLFAPPNQQGLEIARRALPHELTHAVVHQVTDNPFGEVPQWLNEGLAGRSEQHLPQESADALAKAIAEERLISLRALTGTFPVDSDEAVLAYAESYSAVGFLQERYGRQRLNALLQAYRAGVTADEGLQQALGVDTAQFEADWRAWLVPWPLMKATPFAQVEPAAASGREDAAAEEGLMDQIRALVDGIWGQKGQ